MTHTPEDLGALSDALGYSFSDPELLSVAVTHTSFVKGDGRSRLHNERLEFLGDAVLELLVSDYLFSRNPDMQEGMLTKTRARLVCEQALFEAARALNVPAFLRLGHGEAHSGGREKPSIVSDALEAIIGAVYLDGGMDAARTLVIDRIIRLLEAADVDATDKDYKTRLQEFIQRDHRGALRYALISESGPEHQKLFTMRVLLDGESLGEGSGASKQSAGQEAARVALAGLTARPEQ